MKATSAAPTTAVAYCRRSSTSTAAGILVNNAGITIDKTVAKMSDEDWLRVISVNLSGAFFMAQAALST